jgi:hypothetical protein
MEKNITFSYNSKMAKYKELIERVFHHVLKAKIGAEEYSAEEVRGKINLIVEINQQLD